MIVERTQIRACLTPGKRSHFNPALIVAGLFRSGRSECKQSSSDGIVYIGVNSKELRLFEVIVDPLHRRCHFWNISLLAAPVRRCNFTQLGHTYQTARPPSLGLVTGGSSGIVEHNRRAHDSLVCGHCRKTKTAFSTTLTIKVPFPGAGIVNRSVHTGELEGSLRTLHFPFLNWTLQEVR
jgi:hypothetical protein